jgi:hypothetical protein
MGPSPQAPGLRAGFCADRLGAARLHAARLGGRKRVLDPGADQFALMLGDSRQDVDGQLVGERLIDGDEIDARFHEARKEMNVAAEQVQQRVALFWQGCTRLPPNLRRYGARIVRLQ